MKNYIILYTLLILFSQCKQELSEEDFGEKTDYSVKPIYDNKLSKNSHTFDAGEVVKGKTVKAKFKITNQGKIPLIINNIKPSCGCTTTTKAPEDPISPGDSYEIVAEVTTKAENKGKNFKKRITINANVDPYPMVLYITGRVK